MQTFAQIKANYLVYDEADTCKQSCRTSNLIETLSI